MAEPEIMTRIAGLARSGRLNDAAALVAEAVARAPDDVMLLALGGAIECHRAAFSAALPYLRPAHAMRPDDGVIRVNLAEALFHTGDHAAALALCDVANARADRSLRLARLGANLAQAADDNEHAVALYRIVVAAARDDWAAWNNLGNALSDLGRNDEAIAALTEAASAAPDAPPIRINLGETLMEAGRVDDAVAVLQRASLDFPDDPHPHLALFRHFSTSGDHGAAYKAMTEAARRAPDRPDIQADLGHIANQHIAFTVSEAAFRRALAADPGFTPALVGLAAVLERDNRDDELDPLHDHAVAHGAEDRAIAFIDALRLKRADRFEDAIAALDVAGDVVIASRISQLRGQLLDRLGRSDEAFAAFAAMNEAWIDDPSDPRARAANYRNEIGDAFELLTPDWLAGWTAPPAQTRPSPIFVVGFPRSGTTLLDTMLMTIPAVRVLEEESFIADIETVLGGIAALPALTPDAITAARERYFAAVARVTALNDDTIVVDKHPMHLNKVPIIRRLFPDARFVLALRHPCDVLLSCFITNFRLNDAMANFLDLDDAAALYDLTFRYWSHARDVFGLNVATVVYEDLVADAEAVLRPTFAALDLPWPEGHFDHTHAARARGMVRTASYAQVTEPLYTRAAGRWLRYTAHLQPILPRMQPWIDRFGYRDAAPADRVARRQT